MEIQKISRRRLRSRDYTVILRCWFIADGQEIYKRL